MKLQKKSKFSFNCILCIIFFFDFLSVHSQDIDSNVTKRLLNDEIVVEQIENEDGLPGVRALFLITGTRVEIWKMLNDYKNYIEIYGGIDSLKVLQQDIKGATVEFWSYAGIRNFIGKKIHFVLRRNYDSIYYKMTWDGISGDAEVIEGGWEIRDSQIPAKKLLIYKTFIKYGGIIPTKWIRSGAMSKAEAMCVRLRVWLKNNSSLYN